MPIAINGSGTVTGISAGGLPDGCIVTADLDSAVPVAKAWVNFDGTGTVAIRASYNVSSITDNGVGQYTVNLTTALSDTNGAIACGIAGLIATPSSSNPCVPAAFASTSAVLIRAINPTSNALFDAEGMYLAIFR